MELVPFPEETPESLPCVDIVRRRCLQARKETLSRNQICWDLDLELLASRTVRK